MARPAVNTPPAADPRSQARRNRSAAEPRPSSAIVDAPSLSVSAAQSDSLNKMTPALRAIAVRGIQYSDAIAAGIASGIAAFGTLLTEVCDEKNRGIYGDDALLQLANVVPMCDGNVQKLLQIHRFSQAFSQEFIANNASRKNSSGRYLTDAHWLALSQIDAQGDRERMVTEALHESLTASDIRERRRSGEFGTRNPKTIGGGRRPTAPPAPMQNMRWILARTTTYNQAMATNERLFDSLSHIPPSDVTQALVDSLELAVAAQETALVNARETKAALASQLAQKRKQLLAQNKTA